MMPLAPQLSVPHIGQISASPSIRSSTMKASKPKLSFSIDSIVGKRKAFESESNGETNLSDTELLAKSIKRHLSEGADLASDRRSNGSPSSAGHHSPDAMLHSQMMQHQLQQQQQQQHRQSVSPLSNGSHCATPNKVHLQQQQQSGGSVSPLRSPSPLSLVTNTHSPNANSANPLVNGGMQAGQFLSRPGLGMPTSNHPALPSMSQTSSVAQMPQVAPLGHPNHPMMVAAAAAAAAASSAAHPFPPMPSDYQQAAAFYPWFLRANPFAGRFPGMPFDSPLSPFLLPPFRKPKRIRTAFSPGQLLKLEQAFEKNHYVVGNERKQLANHLGLSETQVKVWFQNRRTKHKRQKQEDEESGSGSVTNGENGNASKDYSDDEEEIDLEEDEESTTSDQEHENSPANAALKFANMHHLWYQSALGAGLVSETPVTSASST